VSADEEMMPPRPYGDGEGGSRRSAEVTSPTLEDLTEVVMGLAAEVQSVGEMVAELAKAKQATTDEPAEWAWFPPPPVGEFPPETVAAWVVFYNEAYGMSTLKDETNPPIPVCWTLHPGLAAEIATLAAAWRWAFIGPSATPENAQNWHDRWRPGFAARLRRWASCTERHVTVGDPPPIDRFTATQTARAGTANDS